MLRCNRWLYYFGALFQSMACAGAIFGWVNMAYMLQKEGIFSSLCSSSDSTINGGCKEQTLAFNNVYSISSVFAFVVPLGAGFFLDRYGPRLTVRILSSLFALGVLLLLLSIYTKIEMMLYPAFILLGSSASSNILPLYSVSNLFPQRKSLALSVLSGAFDSGSVVFLIMARLYDQNIPLLTLLISYLCGPVIILLLLAAFLWPDKLLTEQDLYSTTQSFHNIPTSTPRKGDSIDTTPVPSVDDHTTNNNHDLQLNIDNQPSLSLDTTTAVPKSPRTFKTNFQSSRPLPSSQDTIETLELRIPSNKDLVSLSPSSKLAKQNSRSLKKSNSKHSSLDLHRQTSRTRSKDGMHETDTFTMDAQETEIDASNIHTNNHHNNSPTDDEEDMVKPHTPLFRGVSSRTSTGPSSSSTESSVHDGHQSPMARTKSTSSSLSHSPNIELSKTTIVNTMKNTDTVTSTSTDATATGTDLSASTTPISAGEISHTELTGPKKFLPGIDTERIGKLSLLQQVCTPEYYMYVIFFSFMIIRFQFYIGTINTQLDVLGQVNSEYGILFGYVLPCGAISVFLIGWILDTYGPIVGMFSLVVLVISLSILNLLPILTIQPLTFLLFGFFRGFLFCNMSVYLSSVFGYKYLGTLIGLLTTIGGLLGLIQNPLLLWAYASNANTTNTNTIVQPNFYPPNILMLVLMIVFGLAWPMWLAYRAGLGSLWKVLCSSRRK